MGFTKFGDKRVNELDLLSGYIVGVAYSSWQLCCLARILGRSWRSGTASRQASRLQVDGKYNKKFIR